jgi:hypothetical protein
MIDTESGTVVLDGIHAIGPTLTRRACDNGNEPFADRGGQTGVLLADLREPATPQRFEELALLERGERHSDFVKGFGDRLLATPDERQVLASRGEQARPPQFHTTRSGSLLDDDRYAQRRIVRAAQRPRLFRWERANLTERVIGELDLDGEVAVVLRHTTNVLPSRETSRIRRNPLNGLSGPCAKSSREP